MEEENKVKINGKGVRCPTHGHVKNAEYKQQDPAPCGCAWVWEEKDNTLIAVPS